jgi:hypothetical protein
MISEALDELKQLDQWVVCKLIKRKSADGTVKYDKPPMRVVWVDNKRGGKREKLELVSHSDPSQWMRWVNAMSAKKNATGGTEAYGFVFSDCDPYTGVDLDGCRDPETGAIESWAQRWIDALNSYTEISQSRTGVKIWVRGKLPKAIVHSLGDHKGIEIYSRERYFWMTHQRLAGTPETINDAQVVLDRMSAELDPPKITADNLILSAVKPALAQRIEKSTPGERAVARDVIDRLNQANDLGAYLESKGATLIRTRGIAGYYDGLAGDQHSHGVTYIVSPANDGNGQIGYSYSPNGKLNKTDFPRGFKWFDAVCALEHGGNATDALKTLNPLAPRKGRESIPIPEQPDYLTPAEVDRRAKDRQRHRQERQDAQDQRIRDQAGQTTRLIDDEAAYDTVRRAWMIHVKYYGTVAQHSVSLARMAADLCGVEIAEECHIRKMQRANDWLIERGYLVRTERTARRDDGKQHTNIYTPAPMEALRVSRDVLPQQNAENAVRDTLVNHDIDLVRTLDLVSAPPGASEPAPAAPSADPDEWCVFNTDDCDDAALAWLYEQETLDHNVSEPQPDADGFYDAADYPLPSYEDAEPAEPTIVSVSKPDARGMCQVRWSNGSVTWRRGDRRNSSENTTISAEYRNKTHESVTVLPGASYDPNAARDWLNDPRAVPSWMRATGDIGLVKIRETPHEDAKQELLLADDPDPEVRVPPLDPRQAEQYYKLRGKAQKRTTSAEQRRKLNDLADALMIFVPASEAMMPMRAGLQAPYHVAEQGAFV